MENYKIKVNNESESKEVQGLFFELGYDYHFGGKTICNTNLRLVTANEDGLMANVELDEFEYKEITINQLRDMVVLNRNSADDATHTGRSGSQYYIGVESYFWDGIKWEQRDFLNLGYLKPIEKEVKMKEYLVKTDSGNYLYTKNVSDIALERVIEVPEGAEIFLLDNSCGEDTLYFVKHDEDVFHEYYIYATGVPNNTWIKGTIKELHKGMGKVLWQRNRTITPNTSIQNKLKPKNEEVKMKEFLNPEQGYSLVKCCVGETPIPKSWIEVPEGAEEYRANYKFYKNNCELFYSSLLFEWTKSSMPEYITLWQRKHTTTPNTPTQEKLKFIEKWLNGEKVQYILGVESEKTQTDKSKWHNFTEGAMRYIKRPDIKFREAPKYVTINGIEFKSVESLLKHVKNNFDLEDDG